ncbi:RHS repeat domain-containing protein [Pseudomonas sp. McL0111]|uniref:RHS repeat domain-containing protein n=1 Tax=Pseudomonas sp. McL0111 TaxID=3457357 RepID=UPI00403E5CCC
MSIHRRTPSLEATDSRGLAVRRVAYWRSSAGATPVTLVSRLEHDLAGRNVAQWDPRLSRPSLVTVYTLQGQLLKTDNVDAGVRLNLPGLAGQTLQRWDGRDTSWLMTYDRQLRPLSVKNAFSPADDETIIYADASADAGCNLRGRQLRQVDVSGSVQMGSYNLAGQAVRESRLFFDGKSFTSQRTYSPLGLILDQTDAGQHRQQMHYDLAGQLKTTHLALKGGIQKWEILLDAQYNAAGQLVLQKHGNAVSVHWQYNPANAHLVRQWTQKGTESPIQDFEYTYDPVGMITKIVDAAVKPDFFANQRYDGTRTFSYDSLYQLRSATGCSASNHPQGPSWPQPGDSRDLRQYRQTYEYDHGGNLIRITQVRENASHTQHIFIDPHSNRGILHKPGDPPPDLNRLFDPHGNLLERLPGQPLLWNSRDQLRSVVMVSRPDGSDDAEHYRYSQGQRVFKRHDRYSTNVQHFQEVRYLPGLEISGKENGEELHSITVTTGAGTVRCLYWENDPANIGSTQLRYGLTDHLNSCLIELDQSAQLISSERFFPFGATALFTARADVEVNYKTIRYGGKELDRSGFYYYGERYYAPWLGRWTQPDKHGVVDGLNLYCMTGNNPINFVDWQGAMTQPADHTIEMPLPGTTRRPSTESTVAPSPDVPVKNPRDNPPGRLPPKPEQTWREWGKATVLTAVNSRVGLALLPVSTSSPASAAVVSTVLTAAAQLTLHATLFNPGWSIPATWDPAGDETVPPADVTQDVHRLFNLTALGVTTATAVGGMILGPLVGGYVDELRGTKLKAANKEQAGKWLDKVDQMIAELRLQDNVSNTALNSLHDQVVEAEELTGFTWRSMGMLEKITRMRTIDDTGLSRRSSMSSADPGSSYFHRRNAGRGTRLRQHGS